MRITQKTLYDYGELLPEICQASMDENLEILLLLIAGLGAGGAVYWFKFRKQKPDTKGPDDLDDYDFGDDDEDDEEEYVIEDDQPEETDEV